MDIDHYSRASDSLLKLQEECLELRSLILSADIRVDALWRIPFRNSARVGKTNQGTISPVRILGDRQRHEILESLTRLNRLVSQNGRETYRVIGAIACEDKIIDAIIKTNHLRQMLRNSIERMSSRNKVLFWGAHAEISALQAIRTPLIVEVMPISIRFYWASNWAFVRCTCSELIRKHMREIEFAPNHYSAEPWIRSSSVTKHVEAIKRLRMIPPEEILAIKRLLAPSVRARLITSRAAYIRPCSTPILYPLTTETSQIAECPRIKPLGECIVGSFKPVVHHRHQKTEPWPFIEWFNIYRYKEAFREYGLTFPSAPYHRLPITP